MFQYTIFSNFPPTFTTVFISLFILLLYHHRKWLFLSKELANIPSIPATITYKAMFNKTPQDQIQNQYNKHVTKGIAKYWILNHWQVLITKYEYAKDFLLVSVDSLPKWTYPDSYPIKKFLGDGLVFSNGKKWTMHRKIATPAFNKALSPEVVGNTATDLINLLGKLVDQPVDIYNMMQRVTVQVLGNIAFDYDFKCLENLETRHDLLETYAILCRLMANPYLYFLPWLNHIPTKSSIEFKKNLEKFDNKMLEIIQSKKDEIQKSKLSNENSTPKSDLLYGMLAAAEKEGYDISSNSLRDEMVTFFLAGHDTTSLALSVAFYYMAKHPEIQKKAREEAISVLGVKGKIPTSEDLKNLKYINAIIKESLRLYPPLSVILQRVAQKELNYGQMTIPIGTVACVSIWAIHHDPENWPDPEKFIPERFLSNKGDNNLQAWIPFSSGPRNCIGQNFSLMEQRVIISMLLLDYEVSLPLKSPHENSIKLNTGILLSPKNLELIFSKRN